MQEEEIMKFLVKEFSMLLSEGKVEKQRKIALEIDKFATGIVTRGDAEHLSEELQEIIYGCIDIHHWEDEQRHPTYKLPKVRQILQLLERKLKTPTP